MQHEKGGTQTDALQNAKYAMPVVQNALIYMCSSTYHIKGEVLQGTQLCDAIYFNSIKKLIWKFNKKTLVLEKAE